MNKIIRHSDTEFEVHSEVLGSMVTIDLSNAAASADEALRTGAGTRMLVPDWDEPPSDDEWPFTRKTAK